jgi:molecular chaperone DnaK
LTGELKNVVLLDVTPLSLGVETVGGFCIKLIPRNSSIPTKRTEIFTTGQENQVGVDIHVVQGERELAAENESLGHFNLDGIDPAPAGKAQIEVTFDIDHNGIVSASARDLATGRAQQITITASTNLSKDEVERLVEEAAEFAEVDARKRDESELLDNVQRLINHGRRLIETGSVEDDREERAISGAVSDAQSYVDAGDLDAVRGAAHRLSLLLPNTVDVLAAGRLGSSSSARAGLNVD